MRHLIPALMGLALGLTIPALAQRGAGVRPAEEVSVNPTLTSPTYTIGTSATVTANAFTWDFDNGSVQQVDLEACTGGGNCTATLSNPKTGGSYYFIITQGASLETVAWPASVLWAGGTAPTTTATDDAVDVVACFYNGTNYFCSTTQDLQ